MTQSVEPNDIAFGLHAVILTLVCLYQFHAYKASGRAKLTPAHAYIVSVLWLLVLYNLLLVAASALPFYSPSSQSQSSYSLIDYLGYAKAAISGIKYVPQVYMNWRRQSTVGWSIVNILLDFTGGSLSFTQQFIDAYNRQDGNVIWGQTQTATLAQRTPPRTLRRDRPTDSHCCCCVVWVRQRAEAAACCGVDGF